MNAQQVSLEKSKHIHEILDALEAHQGSCEGRCGHGFALRRLPLMSLALIAGALRAQKTDKALDSSPFVPVNEAWPDQPASDVKPD